MCIPKKTYISVRVVHMAEVFGIQYRNARNRRIDIIGGCNGLTNVPVALCSPYHERLSSLYPQDIQFGIYTIRLMITLSIIPTILALRRPCQSITEASPKY